MIKQAEFHFFSVGPADVDNELSFIVSVNMKVFQENISDKISGSFIWEVNLFLNWYSGFCGSQLRR